MWEHVHRLYDCHMIVHVQRLQVAGLGGRITADVDDAPWGCPEDGLHHVGMHAGTWGVGDDDVRTAMLTDEVVRQDILHVTSIEEGVVDAVQLGIDLRVLDGLRHIFDTDDLLGSLGHEVGDGARTGVEVVNQRQGVRGTPSDKIFVFDLTNAEAFRKKTADDTTSTSNSPLYPDSWMDSFGIPVDDHHNDFNLNIFDEDAEFTMKREPEKSPESPNPQPTQNNPGNNIEKEVQS